MLILRAAREVVEQDGFDNSLDNVRDRIDEIESLHRTRELTVRRSNVHVYYHPDLLYFFHSSRISTKVTE